MRVSLFVTCIVDQFFPQVAEATVATLTRLGVKVDFNPAQTCCGQPAFNTGYRAEAHAVAGQMLEIFEDELTRADYVVAPSGSCVAMVKKFYPAVFADDTERQGRARRDNL